MRTNTEPRSQDLPWQCRGRCRRCLAKISGRRRVNRCLCGGSVAY